MQTNKTIEMEIKHWLGLLVFFSAIWVFIAASENKIVLTTGAALIASVLVYLIYRILFAPAQRWAALQTHLQTEESLDVQRNFLSLLSHNLNTPIAKLLGILQILVATNHEHSGFSAALKRCLGRTLRIQYYTKSTLQTSSLISHDEKGIQAVPLKNIFEAIIEALDKLGNFIENRVECRHGKEIADLQHLPVLFEQRHISQLAAGIAYILQQKFPQPSWTLLFDFSISVTDLPSNQNRLSLVFSCAEKLNPNSLSWFASSDMEKDFLIELNQEHAREILRLYQGSLKISEDGKLVVNLNSLPG